MHKKRYRWNNSQLREHVKVLDGKKSPTIVLKNATYLNSAFSQWMNANIWLYNDRIVYVGDEMPSDLSTCEIVDCENQFLVPGYIEPHSHPFQLYNPHTLAIYASKFGTTTLINDNMMLFLQNDKKKAFTLLEDLQNCPVSIYWWCRFDAQTELVDNNILFSNANVLEWLRKDYVIQGGELTGWPKLLAGDNLMLHWIQEAKRQRKKVEGHFPGASEKTLAKLMLLGVDSDHESMTGKDVYNRLLQGYTVSLRHSSIRPDLPKLLDEMKELNITNFDKIMLTTDGSTPSFYKTGIIDNMIRICLEKGIPAIDAYKMATINVAKYYDIENIHGLIATGRIANINILESINNPTPISVIAKGRWLLKDRIFQNNIPDINWSKYDYESLEINWDLTDDDLQFSMPFGIKMENDVITKPFTIKTDIGSEKINYSNDECFFMLIDKNGKWRVNTILKGFASKLDGLASSYSNTGDIILIGKRKQSMMLAFQRMKEIKGGIVLVEGDEVIHEIELTLLGLMSKNSVEQVIEEEELLVKLLNERGYHFSDPIYSLLFFSSTHLPYIRITQKGMFDVMNNKVLFPAIMR